MNKSYKKAELEIIEFDIEDVITTSSGDFNGGFPIFDQPSSGDQL